MMWPIKQKLGDKFFGVLALVYSFCITLAMLLPVTGGTNLEIPFFDKVIHVLLYVVFVFIWLLYFEKSKKKIKKDTIVISLLIFIYGIIIEVLQGSFIATRSQDFWDVFANGIGIFLGILVFYKTKGIFIFKN